MIIWPLNVFPYCIINLNVAKNVDLKCSHHKKKRSFCAGMAVIAKAMVVTILPYVNISKARGEFKIFHISKWLKKMRCLAFQILPTINKSLIIWFLSSGLFLCVFICLYTCIYLYVYLWLIAKDIQFYTIMCNIVDIFTHQYIMNCFTCSWLCSIPLCRCMYHNWYYNFS